MSGRPPYRRVDFARVARVALGSADSILARWLPDGRRDGQEWVARNPTRTDGKPGSFKVNLRTGRWGDFATDDYGRDLVALAAYLFHLDQREAAERVAAMLGISPYE